MTTNSLKGKEISVASYLVSLIEDLNIDFVPVLQGGAIMKMIDEVGESKKLNYIVPNHEQALAMMVDGYARIKGFGVGMVTSGPGAVNLATGIACSYYDSIPCLYITGQVGMFHVKGERKVRQRGFQETDVVSVLKPITKFSELLTNAEDVKYVFEKAVHLATTGRPGPVVIDLPYNVQRQMINPEKLHGYLAPNIDYISGKNLINIVKDVVKELHRAKKPIILVGGGVRVSNMQDKILSFLQKTGFPVVSTWGAADIFSDDIEMYIGNVGKSGSPSCVESVQECDLLLCLGSRFTPKIIINEKKFAEQAKVIAVDIDLAELEEGITTPDVKINADLKEFIPMLIEHIGDNSFVTTDWKNQVLHFKNQNFLPTAQNKSGSFVDPFKFVRKLFQEAPDNAIFITDAGANLTWVMQGYKIKKGQRLISAWGNSPMGYSFPASIGAYFADKSRPVIALTGDGGLQMNIQELQTVVGNNVNLKLFIFNNRCFGNIVMGARREFNGRVHGNDASTGYTVPDFIKVVNAYGLRAETIDNESGLSKKIQNVLKTEGTLVVDINVDPHQEHDELNI
jgi:acetolactate synthase I/II/III large subunit